MLTDINEVEKEILEDITKARVVMSKERKVFPSGIDKDKLIKHVGNGRKYKKYFTTLEKAEELNKKERLVLNQVKVTVSYDVPCTVDGNTSTEIMDNSPEIDEKLGVIQQELTNKIVDKLSTYLDEYPSMKIASKVVIVVDDIQCNKIIMFDEVSFERIIRYHFTTLLNIYLT